MKLKPLFLPLAGLRRAASRGRRQNMSPFGRLSSRAGRALEVLAVTGCLLVVAVGPAAADHPDDPHCNQRAGTNACLWVSPSPEGGDIYLVRVGIDVSMGAEDVEAAQQHKAAGGQVLSASIWGNDPSEDDLRIENVPLLFEGPGPNGWGGEFRYTATGRELDEDDKGDGPDEIVGRIKVYFPRFNQFEMYETGQVNHEFGR